MPDKKKTTTTKQSTASAPSVSESAKEAKSPAEEKVVEKPQAAPVSPPPRMRPVLVSFARWFAARSKVKGWKPHWVAGMKAYANTSGRLPMEGWDDLFKNY